MIRMVPIVAPWVRSSVDGFGGRDDGYLPDRNPVLVHEFQGALELRPRFVRNASRF